MREIKEHQLFDASGGSLTSDILDFFRGSDSSIHSNTENKGWTFGSEIQSPAIGKGDEYGLALVTGLVTIAAAVATGIKFFSGK